jgi:hypothetical protein
MWIAGLGRRKGAKGLAVSTMAFVCGCASIPDEAYRLPPSTLEARAMQTFTFEGIDEAEIMGATVALIQDMEYNLDEVERPLGVLTASKTIDADSVGQKAGLLALDVGLIILAVLSGSSPGGSALAGADDEIELELTFVIIPSLEREHAYSARLTLQRTLIDKSERIKERGVIEEPKVYQEIFDKLSKSVFLEEALP